MIAANLKRLRPVALMLFAVGIVAFVPATFWGTRQIFLLLCLVAYLGLAFFTFTEGFLSAPPDRARFSIWLARIYLVLSLPAGLFLEFAIASSAL